MQRFTRRPWWLFLALAAAAGGEDLDVFADSPAGPTVAAAPRLEGEWVYRGPELTESLQVFGSRRFVYHHSAGGVAAGTLSVEGALLRLAAPLVTRVFAYELSPGALRLIPDADDRPVELSDLAAMSPHGSQVVTWRRRGAVAADWSLPLAQPGDVAGTYRVEPVPGQPEELSLNLDGTFLYRGRGTELGGRYRLAEGGLELTSGPLTRRFEVALSVAADGWRLRLAVADEAPPRPINDLADLPPAFGRVALYRRPLAPPAGDELLGRYQLADGQRLIFATGGELRYGNAAGAVLPCRWELDGVFLDLRITDDRGATESRRFLVQRLPDGLLLVDTGEGSGGAQRLLADLPPVGGAYARYSTF